MADSKKTFSIKEEIRYGFEKAKAHWQFFVPVLIISWIIENGNRVLYEAEKAMGVDVTQQPFYISFALWLLFWILETIISIGLVKIAFKIIENKKAVLGDLFKYSSVALIFKYILGTILYMLIITLGLILLVIPGIIFAIRFQFYGYLIIDKDTGPVEALKMSWKMTDKLTLNLFLFGLLMMLINIVGALALVIGLFIAVPTTMLATANLYRKLEG